MLASIGHPFLRPIARPVILVSAADRHTRDLDKKGEPPSRQNNARSWLDIFSLLTTRMNSFAKAHKVRSVSLGADVSLSYISFAGAQTYIAPNSSDSSSQGLSVFLASASTLFLLLSVVRIWKLRSNSIKVVSNHQNLVKIVRHVSWTKTPVGISES